MVGAIVGGGGGRGLCALSRARAHSNRGHSSGGGGGPAGPGGHLLPGSALRGASRGALAMGSSGAQTPLERPLERHPLLPRMPPDVPPAPAHLSRRLLGELHHPQHFSPQQRHGKALAGHGFSARLGVLLLLRFR